VRSVWEYCIATGESRLMACCVKEQATNSREQRTDSRQRNLLPDSGGGSLLKEPRTAVFDRLLTATPPAASQ
jgi:hypothetical protein